MPQSTAQEEQEHAEYVNATAELPAEVQLDPDGTPQGPLQRPNLEPARWLQSQHADPVLQEVWEWAPSKATLRVRPTIYHCYARSWAS